MKRVRFTMLRKTRGALFGRRLTESVHGDEMSERAVELILASGFARESKRIPERIQLFSVVFQNQVRDRRALFQHRQFDVAVRKDDRFLFFENTIGWTSGLLGKRCGRGNQNQTAHSFRNHSCHLSLSVCDVTLIQYAGVCPVAAPRHSVYDEAPDGYHF
jgi:hypothetical protein